MPLINSIVSWLNVKRMSQIDLFKKYPFDVQQETILKLIQKYLQLMKLHLIKITPWLFQPMQDFGVIKLATL